MRKKYRLGGDWSLKPSRLSSENAEWRHQGELRHCCCEICRLHGAKSKSCEVTTQQKAGGERATVAIKHPIYNCVFCHAPSCQSTAARVAHSCLAAEQSQRVSGRHPAAAPDLVTSDSSFISCPHCSQQPRLASRDTTQAANAGGRTAKHAQHNVVRLSQWYVHKKKTKQG